MRSGGLRSCGAARRAKPSTLHDVGPTPRRARSRRRCRLRVGRGATHHSDRGRAPAPPPLGLARINLLVVAGYVAQTFAMGGFSFWAPSFLYRVHHMALDQAGFFFSASLAATGLVATLLGVFWATRWQRKTGTGYAWVLALSAVLAAPLAFAAFSAARG